MNQKQPLAKTCSSYIIRQSIDPKIRLFAIRFCNCLREDVSQCPVKEFCLKYPLCLPRHYFGEQAAEGIPQTTPVEFPDLGHSPQTQEPERFREELLKGLADQ
tara:strand:+ start:25264 stop:25572 length:309 start_codon:yes stop_codon:yes gene_type:complete